MRRAVDILVDLIQFAGVAVIFAGVAVAVGRATVATLTGRLSQGTAPIRLDLARTAVFGLDLLLVSSALEVAVWAREASFRQLAAVVFIRLLVSLLIAEHQEPRDEPVTGKRPTRRRARPVAGRFSTSVSSPRRKPARPQPRPASNLWPDRARLGRS
jgi:uncharacterized membrane protein